MNPVQIHRIVLLLAYQSHTNIIIPPKIQPPNLSRRPIAVYCATTFPSRYTDTSYYKHTLALQRYKTFRKADY